MRLSVLDLVPVRSDQSTSDALSATTRLAQTADRLGYTRYWIAEHHNMPAVAATSPPVLIAHLAAHTSTVRLGSGGVMLPNHAPLAVAEQFALLEAAHPGRIDLGIGRAPGSDPVTSMALRGAAGRDDRDIEAFPEYLDDVVALMSARGVRVPLPRDLMRDNYVLKATPAAVSEPKMWLLGSSMYSARLAAAKGLPYVFAHHFSGQGTEEALRIYRDELPAKRPGLRAGDLPDGQRGGGRNSGRGNAFDPAESADDGPAADRPASGAARPRRGRRTAAAQPTRAGYRRRGPAPGGGGFTR